MTDAAAHRYAFVFYASRHCLKSPLVRVDVTTRAGQILPAVLRGSLPCELVRFLVAAIASNGRVAAG